MVSASDEKKILRCAVYTRKSTEEGLDTDFNSLDAQREAAENFIASQKMNGWQLLPGKYDDGGFSGGNTERPALKRLLADVEAGMIDIIVIYKLDRLSRSLLDFMKLIEFFDAHGTSIVSVTQQINTSTSAGRMMLNVLMSFAQYERETIADRIRDKIAGAKRRGKFCGGTPVLGYDSDSKTKKLFVNDDEAALVRNIFKRYCELASGHEVARELNRLGRKSKTWVTRKGKVRPGGEFTTSLVWRILNNPLYIGLVPHKDKTFPGEHEAIVDKSLWETTHALLDANTKAGRKSKHSLAYPLKGLVRCGYCGGAMTTTYTQKKNRRYIYLKCVKDMRRPDHVCPLRQLPGEDFEKAVLQQLAAIFRTPSLLARTYDEATRNEAGQKEGLIGKQDSLTTKLDTLRREMLKSADTVSHEELERIQKETLRTGAELSEVKKLLKILSESPVSQREISEAFNNMESLWEELFPTEKHRLARLFIERVTITNDRMELEIKTHGVTSLVRELDVVKEKRE